tara:strand:- start:268 stop:438 length:171 start_codon:yes stop_codon:yes gene_type:complete
VSDIYKEYKKLEHEHYKLEQRIYYLEHELTGLSSLDMKEAFDRVQQKMNEQFGEEE